MRKKYWLIILAFVCSNIISGCGGSSDESGAEAFTISLKTLNSDYCSGADCDRPLSGANVLLRKLGSTDVLEVTASDDGELYLSLEPGDYEIGLTARYAYTTFMEIFGESACNFDNATNSCSDSGNGCYATQVPLQGKPYPTQYRVNEDPGSEAFVGRAEAITYVAVRAPGQSVRLDFGLRCL